ncbi:MAG TPA: hypothetical protein VL961_08005 [Acidimicrobiales bacterium]|nr:hypothetical protein [Acidimicrobiales bacterium]
MAVLSSVFTGAVAGANGILPPSNPTGNIVPSSSDWLTSIDTARSDEGVAAMTVSESMVESLPIPEQIFILVNLERIDRGLPAISYMSAELNAYASGGANAGADPSFPSALTGGSPVTWGGAIWAGGLTNVFEADYYWMYEDGYGGLLGATSNEACGLLDLSGCWGHRDIILHEFASCGGAAPTLVMGAAYSGTGYPGGSMAAVLMSTCGAPPTDITLSWVQVLSSLLDTSRVVAMAPMPGGQGYWEAQANGQVGAFGQAQNYGSLTGALNSPIVGMAPTGDGLGYWLVAADGGVFAFGDAAFYGSAGALHLVEPIVGMTATRDGHGYWLVAADGGIFSFGDATFRGSMGGHALNQPIVGMATDLATGGYWLVAADGGIFSFGAPFFGSTGNLRLNKPIVGMEALSNGQGYRFEASDGGVFDFGQAAFDGSMGGQPLVAPVVGMANDGINGGYWLVAADGGVFTFGGAGYFGRLEL